ncbi:amid-like mitochondrial oxidoreductase protein [Pochonia chlamydosporia 170]|uniref:Amid-like mitochondrial oxidoreductase protein n=1 Tax=Pochonia chlamydosporia 170 TaxID=1380566 RepID=A0A179G6Y8_METCM|nr:amid-like mitochondrial oxidoreductase protein [Pochonia chlamydosporia 170]OAQ73308.1 amid-like mitochondrial oxidoreductase protein [Pochonia chlamydosporia 170]
MVQTVVILGAGWSGLPLTHKLLKYTAPKTSLKVVLITPNSHFFWNVAATRGLIPGEIPDSSMFIPIAPGFDRYPSDCFEFVLGAATGINQDVNSVQVVTNGGSERSITYDQLVIATGSHIASGLPLKPIGTHEQTLERWHDLQKQVQEAKSILIGGAGPTGLEVAGELAAKYGSTKEITIVLSGTKPLGDSAGINDSVCNILDNDLEKLGVGVIRNVKVQTATKGEDGRSWHIVLSDGKRLSADLYLPLFGVQVNTSFIPKELLDSHGNVNQDKSMKVKGTNNIWAIGDVGNTEPKQLTLTDAQIIHVAGALHATLTGSGPVAEYEPANKTMIFLSLGRKFATGQIGSWRLWGWTVAWVKGRRLFVDTADGYVGGERLRHGSM